MPRGTTPGASRARGALRRPRPAAAARAAGLRRALRGAVGLRVVDEPYLIEEGLEIGALVHAGLEVDDPAHAVAVDEGAVDPRRDHPPAPRGRPPAPPARPPPPRRVGRRRRRAGGPGPAPPPPGLEPPRRAQGRSSRRARVPRGP